MSKEEFEDLEGYEEDTTRELTDEEMELLQIDEEQGFKVSKGQVEFKTVNHSKRAVKYGRVSEGDITKYVNIALEYFDHRCALSGEKFEVFDKKVDGKKTNLSAEHVVALVLGGDDIVPNIVPTVLQYNLRKNGYYILDYWNKQKDTVGKNLYSPYRLLKLVNYMMKSIEARKQGVKDIKQYRKVILTPNEIDEFLAEIEKQDEEEPDNTKKKLHSDTITATTIDEDNKKILTQVPQVEGNIPTQREQQEQTRDNEIEMMDIFLTDAVSLLKKEQELEQIQLRDKDGKEISLQQKLDQMLEKTIGVVPFEVKVRNTILEKLEDLGITQNKYSVANDLLKNTEILGLARENQQDVNRIVEDYIEKQLARIREEQILSEEQLKTVISNMPSILYDEKKMSKIRLWSTYRKDVFQELISGDYTATDEFVDVIIILKKNGVDLSGIKPGKSAIKDLISNSEDAEMIMRELQEILDGITDTCLIGKRLNNQKNFNMNKLKKEIEKAELELTEKEIKVILEKENNQGKSERATEELVQVLVVLKKYGIDLSNITKNSKIYDLISDNENAEMIMRELQKTSDEITKTWPIGVRLDTQKINIKKLKEKIEKLEIELTDKELKRILEKEGNQEESERVTEELVKVLVVLKKYGIDLSKIKVSRSSIGDLISNNKKEEEIIEKLQEISVDITKTWPIGSRLHTRKSNDNIKKLKEKVEEAGIDLTDKELKVILEVREKQEKNMTTEEFVQILVVLKKYGIDLSKITQKSKIHDLISDNENEERIMEELQGISDDIKETWFVGRRLHNKKNGDMKKLKEGIEKAGIELTDKERRVILEKENNQGKSERATEEFVQVLVVLKKYRIDLSNITQRGKIHDLIRDNENAEIIMRELQEVSIGITKEWPIGKKLNTQKTSKLKELKEKIEKLGIKLTDKERKTILEILKKQQTAQDIGKASYDAPTAGCDEKQDFMKSLERTIEERGKAG